MQSSIPPTPQNPPEEFLLPIRTLTGIMTSHAACKIALLLALSGPLWSEPEQDTLNQSGPNPRGLFSAPTQGILRSGDDEGFGIGPVLPDPTVFEGSNRVETVLQGSRSVDNLSLTAHYGTYLTPRQRLMVTGSLGTSVGALDLDYSFIPEGMDGYFSLFLNQTRSQTGSFQPGGADVGLPGANHDPWLYRTSTGFSYTTDPSQNLTLSAGLLYENLSIHDGPFSGLVSPFDRVNSPLTRSPGGIDRYLMVRLGGLYQNLDDLQFPSQGQKLRFSLDQTIPVGAWPIHMTRAQLNFTHFQPLELWGDQPQTLVFNLQGGSIAGTPPPYEAFNLGGTNSVRGYSLGEIGGGSAFLQGTLEFRVPLGEASLFGSQVPFRLTTFVDYGSALGTANQVFGRPGQVRLKPDSGLGYGAGIQALTDFGLIRVEGGWGLQGRHQLHLSVGDRF